MFELRIAKILSESEIVLNAGKNHDISLGNEYIIYGISEDEIIDPSTNESLGYLELYRGVGVVTNVQESMSILHAISVPTPLSRLSVAFGDYGKATFNNPLVGDCAKPNATKSQPQKRN